MHDDESRRRDWIPYLTSSAGAAAAIGAVPLVVVGYVCGGWLYFTGDAGTVAWITEWGAALTGDWSWFITLTITVLVAFLAADLRGQIIGGDVEPTRAATRAQVALVVTSFTLWAFAVLVGVLVIVDAEVHDARRPQLLVVVPTLVLAYFLTARVGTLVVPVLDAEIRAGRTALDAVQAQGSEAAHGTRRQVLRCWAPSPPRRRSCRRW